ncbi:MAG TPA: M48 family metallopeptidase [Candidatus Hydrogenedentes bacterium]|nr:M48 family metallopeptidase [Candidatus Hydrogenedentota bacterium]HOL77424.1 M48 family metallopeptidase [Candidatus Hydrogenedentota bacterium]HPO84567.1 M48 family metallopeptidase [Candidatus Hydrogenedentota bacterium]
MWEQIRLNKRRSVYLVAAMALLLTALGFVIGEASEPGAGPIGVAIAVGVWLIMTLIAYFQGGNILMAVSGARRIKKEDNPVLFNVVEEMVIASGMSRVPDIYIIDSPALNAFATGRDPEHAAVAVTAGLLTQLNRDQLQGVIAHEISHVVHRDILFMTLLSVMLGSIVMISEVFLRGLFYGRRIRRSRSSSRGEGQAQLVMLILALVLAILAPLLAQIIYFAASRRREYLADAGAAVLTRYPEGLASALEVLAANAYVPLETANRATAPLFIVNPLQASGLSLGLFSTHPPTEERIKILRSMAGGVTSMPSYLSAWARSNPAVKPQYTNGTPLFNAAQTRAPSPQMSPSATVASAVPLASPRNPAREAFDTVRKAYNYKFIDCSCGLKIKIPPNYNRPTVTCPRCKSVYKV